MKECIWWVVRWVVVLLDRTEDIKRFRGAIGSMELEPLLKQLNPKGETTPIILPDVLCPWGCTDFCFITGECEYGLIVQKHLRKVQLNFPSANWYTSMHLVDTSRMDYIRDPDERYPDEKICGKCARGWRLKKAWGKKHWQNWSSMSWYLYRRLW